jgi:hypothetical protein
MPSSTPSGLITARTVRVATLVVERSYVELAVTEQSLDHADIQRMRADPLGDLRRLRRLGHNAMQA